jgi:hypothetical protein
MTALVIQYARQARELWDTITGKPCCTPTLHRRGPWLPGLAERKPSVFAPQYIYASCQIETFLSLPNVQCSRSMLNVYSFGLYPIMILHSMWTWSWGASKANHRLICKRPRSITSSEATIRHFSTAQTVVKVNICVSLQSAV